VARSLGRYDLQNQNRHWNRHAARYAELFLDPYGPAVENPLWEALAGVTNPHRKTVADLGCGTGPLLPYLAGRFERVIALDFAPAMIECARQRLGPDLAHRVTFVAGPMHELVEFEGEIDVAVAVNSLVMPDVRLIDRSLRAIRASLRPDSQFFGIVPSIDAITYHLMLLKDQALKQGFETREAERIAGLHGEQRYYDFAFGLFHFGGLHQKFWQSFELEHRLKMAGFVGTSLSKVLYPWDENLAGSRELAGFPPSWDWFFMART
jgi:SAM-dependent methyltransferase